MNRTGRFLLGNARLAKLVNEPETTPVQSGKLVAFQFELKIVDAQTGAGAKTMLDRLDRHRTCTAARK